MENNVNLITRQSSLLFFIGKKSPRVCDCGHCTPLSTKKSINPQQKVLHLLFVHFCSIPFFHLHAPSTPPYFTPKTAEESSSAVDNCLLFLPIRNRLSFDFFPKVFYFTTIESNGYICNTTRAIMNNTINLAPFFIKKLMKYLNMIL